MAERFAAPGATLIHLVDMDGARAGRPVNLEAIGRVSDMNSDDLSVYWERGLIYLEARNGPMALKDFDKAVKLRPDSSHAFNCHAEICRLMKDYDRAMRELTDRYMTDKGTWQKEKTAIDQTLCVDNVRTGDLGGTATTTEAGQAIAALVERAAA